VKSAAYAKLAQRASHFAIVGVAAALVVDGGVIQSARIGVTGATSHAVRLTEVEKALEGKPASSESVDTAARLAGAKLEDLNSDLHASADYRRAMVQVFSARALKLALARVG
jgi:aerobic carbon-monoxide dehydrogenase medium subunit